MTPSTQSKTCAQHTIGMLGRRGPSPRAASTRTSFWSACSSYVAVADDTNEHYWLVLERVPGVELYKVGDLTVWHAAARWLAQLHARSAVSSHLLRHTRWFYRLWPERAIAIARQPERIAALT